MKIHSRVFFRNRARKFIQFTSAAWPCPRMVLYHHFTYYYRSPIILACITQTVISKHRQLHTMLELTALSSAPAKWTTLCSLEFPRPQLPSPHDVWTHLTQTFPLTSTYNCFTTERSHSTTFPRPVHVTRGFSSVFNTDPFHLLLQSHRVRVAYCFRGQRFELGLLASATEVFTYLLSNFILLNADQQ